MLQLSASPSGIYLPAAKDFFTVILLQSFSFYE